MTQDASRPVSTSLAEDLRRCVQRDRLVLWPDPHDHYTPFVDRLASARRNGALPYDVLGFRGSFLALMFELGPLTGGVDRPALVLHLPGQTLAGIEASPLLELVVTGKPFERALVDVVQDAATGKVRPEQIAAFNSQATVTLDGADAWLQGQLDEVAVGFGGRLRAMSPLTIIEDLLSNEGVIAPRLGIAEDVGHLWHRLMAAIGISEEWQRETVGEERLEAHDVAFAAASWVLAVEYAHDLRRPPYNRLLNATLALPTGIVDACRQVAVALRERYPAFYKRTADETEVRLADEIERAHAEDLGSIDTFRFEERAVLAAALVSLGERAWAMAAEWSDMRTASGSFWLRDDPSRLSAWQLVDAASRLGMALMAAGPKLRVGGNIETLEAAVARYVAVGAAVDQAHRHLEQRRVALLYPQLPNFEALRACLDAMRVEWRTWADSWARDFSALCAGQGFLPPIAMQQRHIFDDVVRPLTQEAGLTAYFVVDALRFEMAEELLRALGDEPTMTAELTARLCELPSLTAVGMNVLAPVANGGKLRPALKDGAFLGFSTGEFRVATPDDRRRAMHDRVGGTTCPMISLDTVLDRDTAALKNTIKQARLLVVHSQEIDIAGESGAGPAVFDGTMQKLRAAWHLLRDVGVRRFVFTADHGFLLLDGVGAPSPANGMNNERSGTAQPHGRKIDPKRRHVYSTVPADHPGEVRVALSDLGYDHVEGYLIFPETTAVFDQGRRPIGFVHGGNSLQERVIPVLTVTHEKEARGKVEAFVVASEKAEGVAGMHCVAIEVGLATRGSLGFGTVGELELALQPVDAPGVQVELCQVRGPARLGSGAVTATVGQRFELFFRLTGNTDALAAIEVYHPSKEYSVAAAIPAQFFEVAATRSTTVTVDPPVIAGRKLDWLEKLPEGNVRQLFEHLAAHGTVTEVEAATILGNPRAVRRFALEFDELATRVPFRIRIDVVGGVKRYTREGAQP